MKTKTIVVLITLIITLSMSACSSFDSDSSSTSKSTFTDKSEIVTIELDVNSNMHSNVLTINNINVDEGEITIRLLTPEGKIITEELLVSPTKYSKQFELEIIPGGWRLEMDIRDASGNYNVKWEAKN
jgi:hypothetical protein